MGKSSFLQDFKAFAMRGNVIDMAVGVIIGGAFGKIVSSIVADVIMPPIGLLVGGVNFTDLKLQLKPAEVVDGVEKAAVTLNYGNFLQATFDFIIIAFSIFLFIRLLAKLNRKKEEVPAPAARKVSRAERSRTQIPPKVCRSHCQSRREGHLCQAQQGGVRHPRISGRRGLFRGGNARPQHPCGRRERPPLRHTSQHP